MTSSQDAVSWSQPGTGSALDDRSDATASRPLRRAASLRPEPGDVRAGLRLVAMLVLTGLPLGVLWWVLAPRRTYRVDTDGAFAVMADSEAAVGADGWFVGLAVVVAVVAATLAWRWRARRGPAMTVALAVGMGLCGVLTWQVGAAIGHGPSAAELAAVGTTVLGPLTLGAVGMLVVGPFVAVFGYLVAVCFTAEDDLGRVTAEDDLGRSVDGSGDRQLGQRDGDGAQAAHDGGFPAEQPGLGA